MNPPIDSDSLTLADFFESGDPDLFAKADAFAGFFADWRARGTYLYRRVLASPCAGTVSVLDGESAEPRRMIMLSSNSYLGLNNRPEVMEAAVRAVEEYGTGMCGAPHLNGTFELLRRLERRLAEFERREDAMVFTTGYQANVGAISGLMRAGDLVVIDRLCHASIIDGCRLAGCDHRAFRHGDTARLESVLRRAAQKHRGKLVVVDGVFSMDGDLAPLPEIASLARRHGARLMVDEAHGTGVLGATGRGAAEHFGLHDEVDLIMGTFSKTLGATGGYVAGPAAVIDYLRHYARPYIFSASPTPAAAAAALAALDIVEREPGLRERLWGNIRHMHSALKALGFKVSPERPESAIMVIRVGADATLRRMGRLLHEAGVFVGSVIYPAVARDESRLRISITSALGREEMDRALGAMASAARECGVL